MKIEVYNVDLFRAAFNIGLGFGAGVVSALVLLYAAACVCKWIGGY